MNETTFHAVLDASRRGDPEALQALYTAHVTPVYRYALSRIRNRHDAEDITQAVFLKAFSRLKDFDARGRASWLPYLFTVARNTIIDHLRKKKDIPLFDPETFVDDRAHAADPAFSAQRRERNRRLRDVIASLPDEQQEVVTLKFFSGLSTEEIAAIMGKRADAIRQIQCRALRSLRAILPCSI